MTFVSEAPYTSIIACVTHFIGLFGGVCLLFLLCWFLGCCSFLFNIRNPTFLSVNMAYKSFGLILMAFPSPEMYPDTDNDKSITFLFFSFLQTLAYFPSIILQETNGSMVYCYCPRHSAGFRGTRNEFYQAAPILRSFHLNQFNRS